MNVFVFGSKAEMCNIRESYNGINDPNRRHLVAGEVLVFWILLMGQGNKRIQVRNAN